MSTEVQNTTSSQKVDMSTEAQHRNTASMTQNCLLPAVLPHCKKPGHGQMVLRPLSKQTPEQKSCGVWYDCPYHDCGCSVLYPVE